MNIRTKQDLYTNLGLSPIICKLKVIYNNNDYAIWNRCLLWNEDINENNICSGYCIYKDTIYKIQYKELADNYFEVTHMGFINSCF